jgi:transposase-like protein
MEPDNIVYTDGFLSYAALNVSEFRHQRKNQSQKFVEARNDINGMEYFWN